MPNKQICKVDTPKKPEYRVLLHSFSNENKIPYQNKVGRIANSILQAIVLIRYNIMTPKPETSTFVSMDVP